MIFRAHIKIKHISRSQRYIVLQSWKFEIKLIISIGNQKLGNTGVNAFHAHLFSNLQNKCCNMILRNHFGQMVYSVEQCKFFKGHKKSIKV